MNISQLDFMSGQMSARRQAAAQERVDDDAITQWQAYSNKLQARLTEVQHASIHREAYLAAREAQQQALREVLNEIAPNHPILKRIKEIGQAAEIASYRANGYQVDLSTGKVRKI
jgi:hypothetical protein